jgi:drug/metabolite transporter (DMT)-like permease
MRYLKHKLLLLLITAGWGLSFPLITMVLDRGMSSNTIVMLRGLFFLVCCCIFFRKTLLRMKGGEFLYALLAGACNLAGSLLQTLGMVFTSPSHCAFLTVTNVVIVPFVALALFREKPPGRSIISVPLCVSGMAVLTGVFKTGLSVNIGDLYSLAGAFAFSVAIALLSHGKTDFRIIAFGLALANFAGGLAVMLVSGESLAGVQWGFTLPALLFMGVVAAFIGLTTQCYVQKYISPTSAALIMASEGVLGSLFSVLLGLEDFTRALVFGGLLIVLSIVVMESDFNFKGRPRRVRAVPGKNAN